MSSPFISSKSLPPKQIYASAIGIALLSTSFGALAADPAPIPDADAADKKADTKLETVEVQGHTLSEAQSPKFTGPLLNTPKSVTIVPQSLIKDSGAVNLLDALRAVPGITFGAGEGGSPTGDRPFIRGFDAQTDTYVDGIRDGGSQSREVFNIEQVEVLKGPSSAYGGRGSAGGSLNLASKSPKLQDATSASVGLGTDAYRRVTADVNRVLGDGIAVRVNVMKHDSDIAGRDEVNVSRWGIAPSIAFGLNSPTKLVLSYYHLETDDLPDAGGFPYSNPFAATSANAGLNGDGSPLVPNRNNFYGLVDRDFDKTEVNSGTIDLSHDFGGWVLRNILRKSETGHDYLWTQPDDSKGNPNLYGTLWRRTNSRDTETDTLTNQTSLRGDFDTGFIKHSFVAGIEYSEEKGRRGNYIISPSTNNPLTNNQACPTTGAATGYNCTSFTNPNPHDPWAATHTVTRSNAALDVRQNTETTSAYAFDTLELHPQWLLNLGLRFDDYSTRQLTPSASAATVKLANDSSFWNYQTGIVFKPIEAASIYLSYGTSSTPPGMDGGDGADGITAAIQDLKPQDSKNLELGVKWDVFDGRLALTGAIFRTEMNNARVVSDNGTTQNVGKKRVEGAEIGFSGNLTTNWTVFGGYTYLDAILVDNGYTVVNGVATPSVLNGNEFPNTAKKSASLWTTYRVSAAPGLTVGGGANYVDKTWGNTANTKFIKGYTRWDAMVSYDFNAQYGLQLNVQNLTNKLYFTKAYSSHYGAIAPGRSATLTFNVTF